MQRHALVLTVSTFILACGAIAVSTAATAAGSPRRCNFGRPPARLKTKDLQYLVIENPLICSCGAAGP